MWVESLGMNSATYIVIEANGLAGLSLACKGGTTTNPADGNGEWLLQGDDGSSLLDATELTRRGMTVNYGDSYELGDARIMVFCREDNAVTLDLLWQNILGKGHVLPDVIVQNFTPVPRMAFLDDGPTTGVVEERRRLLVDERRGMGPRSRMFPLVVGAVGELHKRSYYEAPAGGNNYNYTGAHKYPIRTVLAALIPPLVKPWMRYIEDTSGAPAAAQLGQALGSARKGRIDNILIPVPVSHMGRRHQYVGADQRGPAAAVHHNKTADYNPDGERRRPA